MMSTLCIFNHPFIHGRGNDHLCAYKLGWSPVEYDTVRRVECSSGTTATPQGFHIH